MNQINCYQNVGT